MTVQILKQRNNSKRSNQIQSNFRMQHKNISTATYSFDGDTWGKHTAWKPYEYMYG